MPSELVFRQIPGKLAQWWGSSQGLDGVVLVALGEAMGGGIAGIAGTPTGLSFLAARSLAERLTAGALAVTDSIVWPEPPSTDPARSLPGIWHAPPSSSASQVVNFWRARVGQFWRAPKAVEYLVAKGYIETRFDPVEKLNRRRQARLSRPARLQQELNDWAKQHPRMDFGGGDLALPFSRQYDGDMPRKPDPPSQKTSWADLEKEYMEKVKKQ